MDLEVTDGDTDLAALTEDELCALALGARAGRPPADDAVPLADYLATQQAGHGGGLLPAWSRSSPRWHTPIVLAIVGAFVLIEAFGLCSTFGQVVPA
jgi:hypothetical protein